MTTSFSIGEINIICTNLERSVAFYKDVLGFKIGEQDESFCRMNCGQYIFLLLAIAESKQAPQPYGHAPEFSIDLMVDDVKEAVSHFKSHNVEFVKEYDANEKRVFIRDPDGLVFEVIQH